MGDTGLEPERKQPEPKHFARSAAEVAEIFQSGPKREPGYFLGSVVGAGVVPKFPEFK